MKIYRFTDATGHQKTGNEHAPTALRAHRTNSNMGRESSVIDRVEISEEARRRYETLHVHEIERARTQKIADEYIHKIEKQISPKSDIAAVILRFRELQALKRAVKLGMYDFTNQNNITETAVTLQIFLLAG